jgi:hypothetical protein
LRHHSLGIENIVDVVHGGETDLRWEEQILSRRSQCRSRAGDRRQASRWFWRRRSPTFQYLRLIHPRKNGQTTLNQTHSPTWTRTPRLARH